jgi:hypothetical protein
MKQQIVENSPAEGKSSVILLGLAVVLAVVLISSSVSEALSVGWRHFHAEKADGLACATNCWVKDDWYTIDACNLSGHTTTDVMICPGGSPCCGLFRLQRWLYWVL